MKNLSVPAKIYITGTILVGLALTAWTVMQPDWGNLALYLLVALGAVSQTLKVEGPNAKTNYSIAWFIYGFAFITYGPATAMLAIVIAHLVEWAWHKYPWYIQSFNIGAHLIPVFIAGLLFGRIAQGKNAIDLIFIVGLAASNLVFVFGNHWLVGLVVKFARGQSFAESGVFELLTLSLDFTILTLGAVSALAWAYSPFLAMLNFPLLYPLYHALRVPAQKRQLKEMKNQAGEAPA